MKWVRELLAHFPLTRQFVARADEPERERRHRATITEADRVIKAYRELDTVLKLHVRRK